MGLVYASKAQRAGQRARPFLSKCADECDSMEMNGTRNINSSYLFVLYPCRDLSGLPRLTWLSLTLPVTTVNLVQSINNTKDRHTDTKHILYVCPHFIFLKVNTVDTSSPWYLSDSSVTHVCQPYLNQGLIIDCLHTKSILFLMTFHAFNLSPCAPEQNMDPHKGACTKWASLSMSVNTVSHTFGCCTLSKTHFRVYLLTVHTKL